jgi:hypothetical protein
MVLVSLGCAPESSTLDAGDHRTSDAGDSPDAGALVDAGLPADAGGPPDAGPTLVSPIAVCPPRGTSDAFTNTLLRLDLPAPLDPTSLSGAAASIDTDAGSIGTTVQVVGTSLVVTPAQALAPGSTVSVRLQGDLRDTTGRHLVLDGGTWFFSAGSGPGDGDGYAFSTPWTPDAGDDGRSIELVADGETAVVAWATPYSLWVNRIADGGTIAAEQLHSQLFTDQLSMRLSTDRVYVSWTYFDFSGPGIVAIDQTDRWLAGAPEDSLGLAPYSYASSVAAGLHGRVAVVFNVDILYWSSAARVIASENAGADWSQSVEITPNAYCPGVLYTGERLLFAWTVEGDTHLFTAYSDDNGQTISDVKQVADIGMQSYCPKLIDALDGTYLLAWDVRTPDGRLGAPWIARIDSDGGLLAGPQRLLPDDATHQCVRLVVSGDRQLVVVRSRAHPFERDWVTEVFRGSPDSFSLSDAGTIPVIGPEDGCPAVALHPSRTLDLAWTRYQDFRMLFTSGHPKRPCEP